MTDYFYKQNNHVDTDRNFENNGIQSNGSHCGLTELFFNKERLNDYPLRPLTKQVNQMSYELPPKCRYSRMSARGPGSCTPEFLKVFSDVYEPEGARVVFDCVLLGVPRPRVSWLFNDIRIKLKDVQIENTSDLCRLTIPNVRSHHYGVYTVVAENEAGRAVTSATLLPLVYQQ